MTIEQPQAGLLTYLLVVAAVSLAACSSPPPPPAETKTVTVAPPATTPAAGPSSELIDLTLPPGTVPGDTGGAEGTEVWQVPYSYNSTVQALASQLPVYRDLEGTPWCSIYTSTDMTGWQWADADNRRWIDVAVLADREGKVGVHISSWPGDGTGRQGCDTP